VYAHDFRNNKSQKKTPAASDRCSTINYLFFIKTNTDLSIQSSINPVFSRHIAYQMFKPYVFSLVFALMSRNKGNFLFSADYLIQQSCGSTLRFPCSVSVNVQERNKQKPPQRQHKKSIDRDSR